MTRPACGVPDAPRAGHVLAAAFALGLLARAEAAEPATTDPIPPDAEVDVTERLGEAVPAALPFVDHDGRPTTLARHFGGPPVVLVLGYHGCSALCELIAGGLTRGLRELGWRAGERYQVVTVSLDPHETWAQARVARNGHLRALGAERGWTALTGEANAIEALARAVGIGFVPLPDGQIAHPAVAVVLTPAGRIARYLYGSGFPARQLELALFEAAGGRVGTSFERALLRCYRWEAGARRYELFIKGYLRAGGAVLLLGLGGLIGGLLLRERRLGAWHVRRP